MIRTVAKRGSGGSNKPLQITVLGLPTVTSLTRSKRRVEDGASGAVSAF